LQHILGDRQLKPNRKHVEEKGFILNSTGHNEFVPEIEKYIRTVKERVKATVNTLLFK